jgi:symplekin
LAIQLTKEGEGPGIAHIRAEKQKQYLARQKEGAIPSTPGNELNRTPKKLEHDDGIVKPREQKRNRLVQWDLVKQTKDLPAPEANRLMLMAYKRIMEIESRANQGGAFLSHHQLLVRLASRYCSETNELFEELLIEYIIADQRNRVDLALLWLNELYAQYQGYSLILNIKGEPNQDVRMKRYVKALDSILGLLVNRNDIKEM